MTQSLHHRGPDAQLAFPLPPINGAIGMATLSIVHPGAGFGPFANESKTIWLAFNGEIYNWRSLVEREDLLLGPGETDSHAVLRLYEKLGIEFVNELDGMFAFALFDIELGYCFLGRDPLGQKPLYVWRSEDCLYFASETKALSPFSTRISLPSTVLAFEGMMGDQTPYVDIKSVPAGSVLKIALSDLEVAEWGYWSLPVSGLTLNPAGVAHNIAAELQESCRRQQAGERNALLLSGGIDSCILAYLLRPDVCITACHTGDDPVELERATRVASEIGAEHVVMNVDANSYRDALTHLGKVIDYPLATSAVASEFCCYRELASMGIRLAYTGVGPDELLHGYVRSQILLSDDVLELASSYPSYVPMIERYLSIESVEENRVARYVRMLVRNPAAFSDEQMRPFIEHTRGLRLDQAITQLECMVSLPSILGAGDIISSSFSIEARHPYLSQGLISAFLSVPSDMRKRGRDGAKSALRDAARLLGVPAWVVQYAAKTGFAAPGPKWLSEDLEAWALRIIDDALEICDEPSLETILCNGRQALSHKHDRARVQATLWGLWSLQLSVTMGACA